MRRILSATALAIFLCLAAGASAHAAPADACRDARWRDSRLGAEIRSPRVLKATKAVIDASGLKKPVVVCELSIPYFSASVENLGSDYYVGVTRMLIAHSTDAELRAAIGHEVAHIVLGHRTLGFELTHFRTVQLEMEADALSARWFGKPAMRSLLRKLMLDARRLPGEAEKRQALSELEARIQALQNPNPAIVLNR